MNIVITGTSRGIGKYLAEYFLENNWTVFGCNTTGKSFIKHDSYYHFKVDVTNETEVKSMITSIKKSHKIIDVLINNAGVASMNHFLLTPAKTSKKVMDINFQGTVNLTREATKAMRKSSLGRVINFTTVASPLFLEGEAIYAASKSAVETLTRVLAKELAGFGITVNAIGPTPIKTKLISGVPDDKLEKLIESQAIKRLGEKSDVLNGIKFFIAEESNFITGQIIYLGGVF